MNPSGRPPMKDVPGAFTAKPIPNAVVEPLDQQTIDRLNAIPVEKRFEVVAERVLRWADAIQCTDQEKEAGLRAIFGAVLQRLEDQEALVLILESEAMRKQRRVPDVIQELTKDSRITVENIYDPHTGEPGFRVFIDGDNHIINVWSTWSDEQVEVAVNMICVRLSIPPEVQNNFGNLVIDEKHHV